MNKHGYACFSLRPLPLPLHPFSLSALSAHASIHVGLSFCLSSCFSAQLPAFFPPAPVFLSLCLSLSPMFPSVHLPSSFSCLCVSACLPLFLCLSHSLILSFPLSICLPSCWLDLCGFLLASWTMCALSRSCKELGSRSPWGNPSSMVNPWCWPGQALSPLGASPRHLGCNRGPPCFPRALPALRWLEWE